MDGLTKAQIDKAEAGDLRSAASRCGRATRRR